MPAPNRDGGNVADDGLQDQQDDGDSGSDSTDDGAAELQARIDRLENAIKKERKAARDALKLAKQYDGIDPEEAREALDLKAESEEAKAKAEGRWEELRGKLEEKHAADLAKAGERTQFLEGELHKHLVSDALTRAISDAGFHDDYRNAARLELVELGPKVVEEDGGFRAVFSNDVDGDVPIADFVSAWSQTDAASKYMPGSGATGGESTGTKATRSGGSTVPNDALSIGRNLEAVASGEVTVTSQ